MSICTPAQSRSYRHLHFRSGSALAAAAVAAAWTASASAQSIVNLGALQPAHQFAQATGVSADGTAVVGMSGAQFFDQTRSFRWVGGTLTDVGATPDADNVIGASISADGAWVAGSCYGGPRAVAFRWSQAGGMEDLGTLPGSQFGSEAYGISGDGSVVVGAANADRAFRWTAAAGMQDLGTLSGGTYAWGFAVSSNAQVITGLSGTATGEVGFVWTESGGMQALQLIDGVEYSAGLALSANGAVVAGYSGNFAARWVNGVGSSLGVAPGGSFSVAYAISGNGQVLGGASDNAAGDPVATIWTEGLGMVDLNTYLPTIGVDLSGWVLTTTTGISFDGTTMVGAGMYNGAERGWLVTVPTPGAGALVGMGGVMALRRRRN
jgi:probable HAF family extracellular repeat protein